MSGPRSLGPIVQSFFLDHLVAVKGLRPSSVHSYRDTIRLLLCFVADDKKTKITRLGVEDLSCERILRFLRHLEDTRGNQVRTRNQRLATVHTLFDCKRPTNPGGGVGAGRATGVAVRPDRAGV
jgi:integrase/recombinase XerD